MRCLVTVSILEIMRLWEHGLSQRDIAASVNCGKSTVNDVQQRCRLAGLTYAEASGLTNAGIRARLYPSKAAPQESDEPDWEAVHKWLQAGRRRNLRISWEEYRLSDRNGLCYSQYCRRYREWRESTGKTVTMVFTHEPGKELYVDWMGDTLDCVTDPVTGQLQTAHFFVAALGCSGYPYVEAFPDEGMESWLTAHIHTFEYIGGTPCVVIPDNCKTAVTKPHYYDPKLNPAYCDLAKHYGVAVVPARVRKPKDKSIVEGSVGWLETWLLEWLREQIFFSFVELNRAIAGRVKTLVQRLFQERPGSRASVFEELDKPALRPLPTARFECAAYVTRRVPDNYHIEYEGFYYSVPYTLYKQEVTVRATASMIEVINDNRERVALHQKRHSGSRYVTQPAHMPEKHRRQLENNRRTGREYLEWAATIGQNTRMVIERMLKAQEIEMTAYRACMGVLQCAKKFSPEKLEAACGQALRIGSPCYTTVRSLLQAPAPARRPRPLPAPMPTSVTPLSSCRGGRKMMNNQTISKLAEMRLPAMADEFRRQIELGKRVTSYRLSRLLDNLRAARADGTWGKLLAVLKKPDLLILDDFGLDRLDAVHCRDLLEIMEDRYGSGSVLITAQLPVADWHGVFEDATVADATLDRLVHNAYRIELRGPSRRPGLPQGTAKSS